MRSGHLRSIFGAVLISTCCAAAEKSASPLTMLKALHSVQDSISSGETEAFAMQSKILELLQASLEYHLKSQGVTPDWEEAAVGYALAGAPSVRALEFLDRIRPSSRLHPVAFASKAYVGGRLELAADLFGSIDVGSLPANLAPFAALAKATSLFEVEPYGSKAAFELALNLAPGTLVEEVSARRLSEIAITLNDPELFIRTSFIYWRRHALSPFSHEYIKIFSIGYITLLNDHQVYRSINMIFGIDKSIYTVIFDNICLNLISNGEFGKYDKLFSVHKNDFKHIDIPHNNLQFCDAIHKSIIDFSPHHLSIFKNISSQIISEKYRIYINLIINITEQVNMPIVSYNNLFDNLILNAAAENQNEKTNFLESNLKDEEKMYFDIENTIKLSKKLHTQFENENEIYE